MARLLKKILVCDDRVDLEERIKQALEGSYQIERVPDPNVVLDRLHRGGTYHLLILDLGFPNPKKDFQIEVVGHKIIPDVSKAFPNLPILVSSALSTELIFPVVKSLIGNRQVEGWIDYSETAPSISLKIERILWPTPAIETREGVELGLWIVHLSDLHFGKTVKLNGSTGITPARAFELLKEDLERFLTEDRPDEDDNRVFPHLAVATGDLTQQARDSEFEQASEFFSLLSAYLASGWKGEPFASAANNIIVIPGNHDTNWDISRARSLGRDERGELRYEERILVPELSYLTRYMWSPFEEFVTRLYGPEMLPRGFRKEDGFSYRILDFSGLLNAAFICLGTSQSADHITQKGLVAEDKLRSVAAQLDELRISESAIRILLMHHTLHPGALDKERVNVENPDRLIDYLVKQLRTPLIFTGHIHQDGFAPLDCKTNEFTLWNIGAGTVSGAREDRLPEVTMKYNIVRLHNRDEKTRKFTSLTVYGRHFSDISFKADPRWENYKKTYQTKPLLY